MKQLILLIKQLEERIKYIEEYIFQDNEKEDEGEKIVNK